jgi:hypothetical protein
MNRFFGKVAQTSSCDAWTPLISSILSGDISFDHPSKIALHF